MEIRETEPRVYVITMAETDRTFAYKGLNDELRKGHIYTNMKPANELVFCQSIDSVTDSHGKYLDSANVHGHFGPNGQTLSERFSGFKLNGFSENISSVGYFVYPKKDVKPIIIGLLVDGGIKNRGHRKNLLNPKSKFIGIYMSKKACVQNFAY